ncbi:MAG: hypothetical protein ACFB4J_19200 [Elainellaceae cyanobacterium]
MAILHRFLLLLEFLDQVVDVADASIDSLTIPAGVALVTCFVSYQAMLISGCDALSSSVLASAIALPLHCGLNRPMV